MPKVDDTITVKEGKDLASKLKDVAYKLTLPNGNIMGQFMEIASILDEIEQEMIKDYK